MYEKEVFLLGAGVVNSKDFDRRILDLCDDFRFHSAKAVKAFNRGHHVRRQMLKWITTKGGLTPFVQPLDRLVKNMLKGYLSELYDFFSLTAPVNPATGAICLPSRQQILTWIFEAWDQASEDICAKAWTSCSYKKKNELDGESKNGLVPYSDEQVGELVIRLCGDDSYVNF